MESSLAMRASICLASSSLIRSCQTALCSLGLEGFSPASRVRLLGCKGSAADPSRGRIPSRWPPVTVTLTLHDGDEPAPSAPHEVCTIAFWSPQATVQ